MTRLPLGQAEAVALKTPVLKKNGQTVMPPADLLTWVSARVVQKRDTL